ncbi:uncharacterized protein LOC124140570 [Haliotis rufescens]|uniref:uncharacterized protein LOC124140570 n=1 Tax=Haliotis rufescens TaxID=6454 RepID=UPI001EB059F2|nr:uncharacterized protein LOC124140570 [Haliotis rufescens]
MRDWCLIWFICLALISLGACIKCYRCDNKKNGACGEEFKSYQFTAYECIDQNMKCGKQTQLPLEDGWVGVMRSCYSLGSLPGINETNGCHYWINPSDNFTALICFCDTDMCNVGSMQGLASEAITFTFVLSAVILFMQSFLWS